MNRYDDSSRFYRGNDPAAGYCKPSRIPVRALFPAGSVRPLFPMAHLLSNGPRPNRGSGTRAASRRSPAVTPQPRPLPSPGPPRSRAAAPSLRGVGPLARSSPANRPSRQGGGRRKAAVGAGSGASPASPRSKARIGAHQPTSGAILDNDSVPPTSGDLGVGAHEQEGRPRRILQKRRRGGSEIQGATSEESSTARSRRRPTPVRMDPSQSNVGEGSQGQFSGGNMNAYQPAWNPYMYGYQAPPGWFPQGFQPRPPNVAMVNPSGCVPQGFQHAEIAGANVQDSEPDLEEVEVPAAREKTRKKKSVTRTKLGNFNPDEDTNLVKSWLEISCDPITSNGQKRDRMWQRIMHRYNTRRASNPERTVRSLQSRWDTIKAEVTLFASYYADIIRENPSGMSDADKTTHAVANFAAVLQRKFGYLHCWELMKDAPKWQDPIASAARGEGFGGESPAGTHTVDLEGGQSSPVRSGAEARRPMGRDAAKAARKKANSDAASTSSAEYAAKMQDLSLRKISIMQEESVRRNDRFQQLASIDEQRFEEMRRHNEALLKHNEAMLQMEQEKFRFMREQHEQDKLKEEKKEDERILSIDLDACAPALRTYYQICQQEILERQAARRRRREGP